MFSPRRTGRLRSRRGIIDSAMKTNRWFFLFVVPVLWATCSLIHFHFPGDEYAMWVIDSMAGAWVLFLAPNVGDIHQWWIRFSVAGTGALVMAMVGWMLCRLKVRKSVWTGFWVVGAAASSVFMMSWFASSEQALAKNGSRWAYVFSAAMIAAYFATLLTLIGCGVKVLARKLSNPLTPGSGPGTQVAVR